jgi:F-type H+-transporting ATPase subunit c
MDVESTRLLAKGLTILAMMPTALGEGYVVAKAMEAMGRNPDAADAIFPKMIVGVAMCESTAIYALVAFFLL